MLNEAATVGPSRMGINALYQKRCQGARSLSPCDMEHREKVAPCAPKREASEATRPANLDLGLHFAELWAYKCLSFKPNCGVLLGQARGCLCCTWRTLEGGWEVVVSKN